MKNIIGGLVTPVKLPNKGKGNGDVFGNFCPWMDSEDVVGTPATATGPLAEVVLALRPRPWIPALQ